MTKDEALKLALEYVELVPDDRYNAEHIDREALVTAIREALAQPEQEPVAWKDMAFARLGVVRDKMHHADVKTIQRFLDGDYTTPPHREPLTEEEIGAILEGVNAYGTRLYIFARAIEAAHGIKKIPK